MSNNENCQSHPKSNGVEAIESSNTDSVKPLPPGSNFISFSIWKRKISICKPLLLLKVCLFLYYGAGSFMTPFMTVLFKERGVSLNQLSFMLMITPVVQTFGSTISGIIADKIGRAKPVFMGNVFITVCLVLSIIFLPSVENSHRNIQKKLDIACDKNNTEYFVTIPYMNGEFFNLTSCTGYDSLNSANDACVDINYTAINLKEVANTSVGDSNESYYSMIFPEGAQSWCSERQHCFMSCQSESSDTEYKFDTLIIAYACSYVLFLSAFSTSYRCLDVTVMFMVKEHDSSFGHERFFAMLGMVVTPPIAGYLADVTATAGTKRNYNSALYFFIALSVFMVPFLSKMPMKVRPKGENMRKKALKLSKNPEVMSFFILITVLGAGFNFGRSYLYWYLEGLKASSVLIGLITSVNALYGLPFLLTSHWWVKKLGAPKIFVLACIGYAINGTGYSLLQNPWFSLVLECTGILTYYLLWVAAVEYSHDIATEGLTATVIAVAGAIHYSVGKLTAGLVGRFVMDAYGGAIAFRFLAASMMTAGVLYSLFLFIHKKNNKKVYNINTDNSEKNNGDINNSRK